jgi:hypothetical protein
MNDSRSKLWDRVGACASALCAVHCVLTGVALGLLSSLGLGFFGNIWVDVFFVLTAVVVGAIAMRHGIKKHGSFVPASFYVLGLVSVLVAHFEDFSHGWPVHQQHHHGVVPTILSVVGGTCFVLFHVLNLRLQHQHDCNCGTGCAHDH